MADNDDSAPSQELPAPAPDLFDRAREAVTAIRGQGRRADGTAGPGNTLAMRHGLHSAALLDQPDMVVWHQEQVDAIEMDLGGASELSVLQRASVREAARLEVILSALGRELLAGGVMTQKGAVRAATNTYLSVLDRFTRLAATIGLQRRTRPVPSAREVLSHHTP